MNKRKASMFFLGIIITSMFSLTGCFLTQPSEIHLLENGLSLQVALPSFLQLKDNFSVKQKIHQTNGDDWYSYKYVKFNNNNIFDQSKVVSNANGFLEEENAFTDYEDYSQISYTLFKQENDVYLRYEQICQQDSIDKYVYYDTQENDELAQNYHKDFSFLSIDDFEYFEFADADGKDYKVWKILDSKKNDITFKTMLLQSNDFDTSNIELTTMDFFFLTVTNNQLSAINFSFWGGIYNQNQYYINTNFDYQNYSFDASQLSNGFIAYGN